MSGISEVDPEFDVVEDVNGLGELRDEFIKCL